MLINSSSQIPILGLVVCGGDSRRMGKPKSTLIYHETPQANHAYHLLGKICNKVYFSVKAPNREQLFPAIEDDPAFAGNGPMSGLLTAIKKFPDHPILLLGCDYPFITENDIRDLLAASTNLQESVAYFNSTANKYEPLLAFYHETDCRKLAADPTIYHYSLQQFLKRMKIKSILPKNEICLRSIDTPEAYLQAQKMLKPKQPDENNFSTNSIPIVRVKNTVTSFDQDELCIEEPLGIALEYSSKTGKMRKEVAVTMRTPGLDNALAAGFLFTEGIISHTNSIEAIQHVGSDENHIRVICKENYLPLFSVQQRNFYMSSSCGICGKASIDHIHTQSVFDNTPLKHFITATILQTLPETLREQQLSFKQTGGNHAAGWFDANGNCLTVCEDIGRHNALDKLIGTYLLQQQLPMNAGILLLSGRASFEMLQKASMAGIRIVASIGAPSSLAVALAIDQHITLIGFLSNQRFNIYSCPESIILE